MANKDPAFLFYPSDFEMGTMGMSYTQKGKYITLLNMQHSKGGYLKERDIKRILNFDREDDLEILEKFKHNENGYYNERLLNEIEKRRKHSQKQRENVLKRWNKKTKKLYGGNTVVIRSYNGGNTNVIPLENENRIININKSNLFKRYKLITSLKYITSLKLINSYKVNNYLKKEIETETVINNSSHKEKKNWVKIKEYWNKSGATEIRGITDIRKKAVNARIKEHGLESVYQMIDMVSKSPFLKGENDKGWKATFDWCFLPTNFVKVLEGNYVPKSKPNDTQIDWLDDYIKKME